MYLDILYDSRKLNTLYLQRFRDLIICSFFVWLIMSGFGKIHEKKQIVGHLQLAIWIVGIYLYTELFLHLKGVEVV